MFKDRLTCIGQLLLINQRIIIPQKMQNMYFSYHMKSIEAFLTKKKKNLEKMCSGNDRETEHFVQSCQLWWLMRTIKAIWTTETYTHSDTGFFFWWIEIFIIQTTNTRNIFGVSYNWFKTKGTPKIPLNENRSQSTSKDFKYLTRMNEIECRHKIILLSGKWWGGSSEQHHTDTHTIMSISPIDKGLRG